LGFLGIFDGRATATRLALRFIFAAGILISTFLLVRGFAFYAAIAFCFKAIIVITAGFIAAIATPTISAPIIVAAITVVPTFAARIIVIVRLIAASFPVIAPVVTAPIAPTVATPITTLCARLVLASLVVGYDAIIVVGELQVLFHLHTVTIVLRILRELFVFIQQLRRIAACTAVNPVELVSAATLIAITATAATIVTLVIQGKSSLSQPEVTGHLQCSLAQLNFAHITAIGSP